MNKSRSAAYAALRNLTQGLQSGRHMSTQQETSWRHQLTAVGFRQIFPTEHDFQNMKKEEIEKAHEKTKSEFNEIMSPFCLLVCLDTSKSQYWDLTREERNFDQFTLFDCLLNGNDTKGELWFVWYPEVEEAKRLAAEKTAVSCF